MNFINLSKKFDNLQKILKYRVKKRQMANFKDSPHFEVFDDYYTPESAWVQIGHIIPEDKIIWEACMLNAEKSQSPNHILKAVRGDKEMTGCTIKYSCNMDCLKEQPDEWDLIITNIPFDKEKKIPILKKFVEYDKPFITIMNSCNLYSNYMREIFGENMKHLQIIHPRGKINFHKLVGEEVKETKNCSFYSVYVCYKMNLKTEDLWIR